MQVEQAAPATDELPGLHMIHEPSIKTEPSLQEVHTDAEEQVLQLSRGQTTHKNVTQTPREIKAWRNSFIFSSPIEHYFPKARPDKRREGLAIIKNIIK